MACCAGVVSASSAIFVANRTVGGRGKGLFFCIASIWLY